MNKLYSDEQLIAFFVSGNYDAWKEFFLLYDVHSKSLAKNCLLTFKGSGITYSEFYSICIESIFEALNHYELYSCTFYSFWKQICNSRIQGYVKEQSYNSKGNVYSGTFSLDDSLNDSNTKYEEVYGLNDPGIENDIKNKEIISYLLEKMKLLSEKDKQFFFYLIEEKSQQEIMLLLGLNIRQFYRIRDKIRKIMDLDIIKDYFK